MKSFEFPAKPGYKLTGYTLIRYDEEGLSTQIDSLPENAIEIEPNRWHTPSTPGCYDLIVAHPVYDLISVAACGGCSGCVYASVNYSNFYETFESVEFRFYRCCDFD